jgi:transketolase
MRTLVDLAATEPRIVFLTGDLGYGVVEPFFDRFPDRAINVGVAEQNMVAMATGLAEAGLIPYVYSIATFASLRPFEFIRNGPVLHRLPVRILGVGGGMEYANNGPTHHALEDVGTLRTLPGLSIVCPNDSRQARAAVEATMHDTGPIYFRLSKQDAPPVRGLAPGWDGTGVHRTADGDGSVVVMALGAAARDLADIGEVLAREGVAATTVAVSVMAPAPVDALRRLVAAHDLVVTIESHHLAGGLGSLVCEVVGDHGLATPVLRCAVEAAPVGQVGSPAHLDRWAGIDAASVAGRTLAALAARPPSRR